MKEPVWVLRSVIEAVHEIQLTEPIDTKRALAAGFINHVVPVENLEAFTYGMAADIVANAPLSISVMKEELRILADAHPMSPEGFERVQ